MRIGRGDGGRRGGGQRRKRRGRTKQTTGRASRRHRASRFFDRRGNLALALPPPAPTTHEKGASRGLPTRPPFPARLLARPAREAMAESCPATLRFPDMLPISSPPSAPPPHLVPPPPTLLTLPLPYLNIPPYTSFSSSALFPSSMSLRASHSTHSATQLLPISGIFPPVSTAPTAPAAR